MHTSSYQVKVCHKMTHDYSQDPKPKYICITISVVTYILKYLQTIQSNNILKLS